MATYPEQRADGSVWEVEYDPSTDAILGERMVSGPTGGGINVSTSPQNAVLENWLTGQAQQQAYTQATKAADDAYRQAVLAGQNESSARNAAITAGSNAMSSVISLLNSYGSGAGLDPNQIAAFIRGEGSLSLPGGNTLDRDKFDLQKRLAEAELQANPRDIFKLAAYTGGGPMMGGGMTGGTGGAMGGATGGGSMGGAGGGTTSGGAPGATYGGAAVTLDQARAELTKAGGGPGWSAGTYGPGTPGFTNSWQNASPQEVANEYFRLSGRQVQGITGVADPLARYSPEQRAALQHIFASRPDIAAHFAKNAEVTGARQGSRYMVTDPNEMMATWGIWNPPEMQQAGGLEAYAKSLGWNGQVAAAPTATETVRGATPTGATSTEPTWNLQGAQGGTGTGTYDPRLYNVPFYEQLRNQYGSSEAFPFSPQVPLPQPNEIPLGYYNQQSPFNMGLMEAAYSTAGLSKDVMNEPFRKAQQAFGGSGGSFGY